MINIGVLTGAALVNGLNPCGVGMMITFLGYLLVFGQKNKDKKWLLQNGLIYVVSVFVTYLMLGLFFYGLAFWLQRLWLASAFKYFLAIVLVGAGLIQLKDVFWENLPIHLRMSTKGYAKINAILAKAGSGMAVLVGFLTTAFSTPCMLPVYIGTTSYLAKSGLPMWQVLFYFLYYNFIFVLPILIILMAMSGGKKVVEMKEWEHKYNKQLRFLMAIFLFGTAYFLTR